MQKVLAFPNTLSDLSRFFTVEYGGIKKIQLSGQVGIDYRTKEVSIGDLIAQTETGP